MNVHHTKPLLSFCIATFFAGTAGAAEKIYWTTDSGNRIQRSNPDGTDVETVVFGVSNPLGLTLDLEHGVMYWTHRSSGEIWQAGLDGRGARPIFALGSGTELRGIVLDRVNRRLYWVNHSTRTIQRGTVEGDGVEDVYHFGPEALVIGVTLDAANDRMYWGDYAGWRIMQADLDGNDVRPLIDFGVDRPYYLEPDVENRQLYWVDYGAQRVQRVGFDGGEVETIVETAAPPIGIALDIPGGKVYWTLLTGEVQRADLDGSNVEDVVTGVEGLWAIEYGVSGVGVPAYSLVGLAVLAGCMVVVAATVLRRRASPTI